MKKNALFFSYLTLAMLFNINIALSQDNSHQDIRSVFINKAFTEQQLFSPGDSCSASNSERHDGYRHSNGYTAFTDSVRMVILFRPPGYPWVYPKICIGWTSLGGVASLSYQIVIYDSAASGQPGNLLYKSPIQIATTIPAFPLMNWYSSLLSVPAISAALGSVYIGVVYDNNPATNCYLSIDEDAATPLWPGWYGVNATFPPVWQQTASVPGFSNYKCAAIRAEGSFSTFPFLCEQFSGTVFPPSGWSIIGQASAYWLRATVSSFGVGSGSAEFDMWNAPSGTEANLITYQVYRPPAPFVRISMAYAPYPATGTPAQDSLIILASTDNGATYISVARLGPTQMQTAPPQGTQFTPTSAQWVHRMFNLPYGCNRLNFLGKSQFGNDLYLDSICIDGYMGIDPFGSELPTIYSLAQNYPNPFNPSTTINFGIPKGGQVKLVVYDVMGKEIEILVNEYRGAGNYKVAFDASKLSSGVYFYKLVAGDFVDTKKMVLVK